MPVDSKRLPVPDTCTTPYAFTNAREFEETLEALIDEKTGLRLDGRLPSDSRPMFASVGVVTQARGSAYVEMGQTKVICAIYGPREVKFRDEFSLLGQINCELKFATFSGKLRRQHQQDSQEKEASLIVKEALEPAILLDKFPKSRIDIFIFVLEDGGSALAAAISSASLSLADGGIEMRDLAVGASLRRFGDRVLVDPVADEESELKKNNKSQNDAVLTIGYLPSRNQVSAIAQQGTLDLESSKQCIQLCIKSCKRTYTVLQQCLTAAVERRVQSGAKSSNPRRTVQKAV